MKKLFFDRNGDVHEAWQVTGLIFGFFVIVVMIGVLSAGIISAFEYAECSRIQTYESNHDYRWSLFTGCMVETEAGYWVNSDSPGILELEVE